MTIRKKALGLTAVAVAAALALAGLQQHRWRGRQFQPPRPPPGTGGTGRRWRGCRHPATTIAMITHETPGDTFWDKIRSGARGRGRQGQHRR